MFLSERQCVKSPLSPERNPIQGDVFHHSSTLAGPGTRGEGSQGRPGRQGKYPQGRAEKGRAALISTQPAGEKDPVVCPALVKRTGRTGAVCVDVDMDHASVEQEFVDSETGLRVAAQGMVMGADLWHSQRPRDLVGRRECGCLPYSLGSLGLLS
jgi:hypothetical protein